MLTLKYLDELNYSPTKHNINKNYYYTNTNNDENSNFYIYPPNQRKKITNHKSVTNFNDNNSNRLNTYQNTHQNFYQTSYNNFMPSSVISPMTYYQISKITPNKKYKNNKYDFYSDTNNTGGEDDFSYKNDDNNDKINKEINNYKQAIKDDLDKKYPINNLKNIYDYNDQYNQKQKSKYNFTDNNSINNANPISSINKDFFSYTFNEKTHQGDIYENKINATTNKKMNYKKYFQDEEVLSPLTQTYWNKYIAEKNNKTKNNSSDKYVNNYIKMNDINKCKINNFLSDDPIDEKKCYQTFSGSFKKSLFNTNNKDGIKSYNDFDSNIITKEKDPSLKKCKSYYKRNYLNYLDIIPNQKYNYNNKITTFEEFQRNNMCINKIGNNEIKNNFNVSRNNKNVNNNTLRGKSHNNFINVKNNDNNKDYDYKNKLNKIKMKTEGLFNVYLNLLKSYAKNNK